MKPGDSPRAERPTDPVRNVLVVAPGVGSATAELCTRLLTDTQPVDSILGVSVVQSPDDRRRSWEEHGSLAGLTVEFVDVASTTRAASADAGHEHARDRITTVEDPDDLATLARTIASRLDAAEGQTALCFHSITDLLGFAEHERALEFLHTVADDVTEAGAAAHYHVDAGAHDDETVALFGTVTDRVIELDRSGSDLSVQ